MPTRAGATTYVQFALRPFTARIAALRPSLARPHAPGRSAAATIAVAALLLAPSVFLTTAGTAWAQDEPADDGLRAIAAYLSWEDVPEDSELTDQGFAVLYRFVAIPAVAISGSEAELDSLATSPSIDYIEYDHELVYALDTATFATGAVDVWENTWWPSDLDREAPSPLRLPDGTPIDGRGVTIGIVDSGVNSLHPDLWYAPGYVEGMPWTPKVVECVNSPTVPVSQPYCDETVGHGTHVAGIAAGTGWAVRNGLAPLQPATQPYVGAAPGAMLAVAGAGAAILVIDATTSLDYMYANRDRLGIDVVSNSWSDIDPPCSSSFPSGSVIDISNELIDAGIPVVFAAANYFPSTSNPGQIDPTWTGTYARNPKPGLLSVANYAETGAAGSQQGDRDGSVSGDSSDGCVKPANGEDQVWSWPDVAAPGTSIASTAAYTGAIIPPAWDPGFYASASGTSMAAPHVAGVIALMRQANPDLTPGEIEQILVETATPWSDGVSARSIGGTTMWGPAATNNPVAGFADATQCKVTPTDAAKARAGDASVNAKFPRYTDVAALTDPDLFICRDFKRGRGFVDAYAAVQKALDLRTDDEGGEPDLTITSPLAGANVPGAPLAVEGNVDRLGDGPNELPTAGLTAVPSTGNAPLDVEFTASGADTDGVIASWSLDFGDGTAAAGDTGPLPATLVLHSYENEGSFNAALEVVDNDGATATATVAISVGGLPVPDGILDADVFAYNEGGVGLSNTVNGVTTVLLNDDVPKYIAGETVSIEARQTVSQDAGVAIGPGTPVDLFIFDADGVAVAGPLPMTGGTESGIFACTPACYFYSRANVVIGDDWEGRYHIAPRATVGGVDHWIKDRAHNGLKKIDVIQAGTVPPLPGTEEPDDTGHDIGDADNDATAPATEVQWVDTSLDAANLRVVIKVKQAGSPAGDSPFLYGIVVNGLNLEVYVLGGTGFWDNTNGQAVTGGTATIDPVTSTITAVIPRSYLASQGVDCPCVGYIESRIGEGQAGGLAVDDRAPDAGLVELKAAYQPGEVLKFLPGTDVTFGSESDPDATDAMNDGGPCVTSPNVGCPVNFPWMDVTKLWISAETPTTFDITMKVRDMSQMPPSVPILWPAGVPGFAPGTNVGGLSTNYGTEFCTNNNAQTYTATAGDYLGVSGRVCYRLSAVNGVTGAGFGGFVVQKDGSGACGLNPDIVAPAGSAFNIAANTVTWRIIRANINVNTISDSVQTCNTTPPTRTGGPVVNGNVLSRLKGTSGNGAGLVVTATFGTFGDASPPANARPYTFGLVAPLSVAAGGPYAGQVDAPIALAGVVAGGTAPYTCSWTGAGATFSAPSSCSATSATFSAEGDHTVTLSVTDSSSPVKSGSSDALVSVTAAPAGERVELFLGAETTPRATLSVATSETDPFETWSGSVDLTGLAGDQAVTAKWFDADDTLLDSATVTVTVGPVEGAPFITILEPADDPSGANPLSGVIELRGEAGHEDGGSGAGAGLNFHDMPIASGSRAGLRATTMEGAILAPCSACQGPVNPVDPELQLFTSVTWDLGPGGNGIDGWWFDIAGFGGGDYSLRAEFGSPMDVFFFVDSADVSPVGSNQGAGATKSGVVPASANWAFVYMRRPTQGGIANLEGALDTSILTLTPRIVVPSAPQALVATPGPEQIALTWLPPANNGGEAPTAYKVYRDAALLTTLGAVLTYVDAGLTPGEDHTYDVTAVNSAGESVKSNAATAAALSPPEPLSITNPADGATSVLGTTTIDGTYTPRSGTGEPGTGNFANTHYFFLLNLNSPCGNNLGYGDHLLSSRLAAHAVNVLGVPAANVHVFNENGVALARGIDSSNYDQLPVEWQTGTAFDGRAKVEDFPGALAEAADDAASGEAAGGAPARLFILQSSHGIHNPANLVAADGPVAEENRFLGSLMCLYPSQDVQDYEYGGWITDALDAAEAANAGVSIETAILVDCSFCGGFADSPLFFPGTTTTAVDSAHVVGPNRVVEVGCTWITECFGNPAVTYDHMFNECTFTGLADGWGPIASTDTGGNPAPDGTGDPTDDVLLPNADHHAKDGAVTMEEAYWCALDSVKGMNGVGFLDPIGIQQMFQLVDQMQGDLFTDEGFVLWDIGADQDLGSKDPDAPLSTELPALKTAVSDEEGDARTPFSDLLGLEAAAIARSGEDWIVLDVAVADLTLSSAELEDPVEYNFFVNDERFGVCYDQGAVTLYAYGDSDNADDDPGFITDDSVIAYDFEAGTVHVEFRKAHLLYDETLPATVFAVSRQDRPCFFGGVVDDDRVPNEGTISTSAEDDEEIEPGLDEVRIRLDGPGGALVNANAVLDSAAGTWTLDPTGTLADGTWTVAAEHFFDPGTGTFASVDGPVSISFGVGAGGDTEAPSQVLNVAGTPTSTTVALTWDASTDDVGVDHYNVYRGGAAGFAVGPASLVGSPVGEALTDTGLVPDTDYFYRVEAVDAAGNRGALSTELSVRTEPQGDPIELVSLFLDSDSSPFASLTIDSSATGAAPWQTNLDTTAIADGAHTIRAEYDDGAGGSAADEVAIHVQNVLSIDIATPAEGADVIEDFTVAGTTEGTGGPGEPMGGSFVRPDGTLDGDHFAVRAVGDAALAALDEAFSEEEGFLALAPALDGKPEIRVLFEGDAPADLHEDLLPDGWRLAVFDNAEYETLNTVVSTVVELERSGPPVPSDVSGIRPGSTLLTNFRNPDTGDSFIGICTANFVWKAPSTGKIYLGAAGHCFLDSDGGFTATHGSGADWNVADTTRVRVCIATCFGGVNGLVTGAVGVYQGTTVDVRNTATGLDSFLYARQQGPGTDFGIVEIPPSLYSQVHTDMPVWTGPDRADANDRIALGDVVVHYGNAIGLGEVFPTKARFGVGGSSNANQWIASTPSAQGDSGSAVNIAAPVSADSLVVGDNAGGVLTHLVGSTSGFVAGTTIGRAIGMASGDAGVSLTLLTDDSQLVVLQPPGIPGGLVATPGNAQVSLSWTAPPNGGSAITGYTVKYGTTAGGPHTSTQSAGTTSAVVSGLTNGQSYFFVVSATNAQGEGGDSAEVSATPQIATTVPDAPTGLAALAGDASVSLSWTAPGNGGSPITGYTVKYGTAAGGPYTGSKNAAGAATTVTGLTNGVTYFFVVSASNVNGEGADSGEVSATPQALPQPTFSVQVRATNAGGTVLDWTGAAFFDGSSWSHDLTSMPLGALTVDARLLRDGLEVVGTDLVNVNVIPSNLPPIADAGADDLVEAGTRVTLSGAGSSDPDADPLTFDWLQTGGVAVVLDGANTEFPEFTAPRPASGDQEDLVFRLTVTDPDGESDTDDVVVTTRILDSIAILTVDGVPLDQVEFPLSDAVNVAGSAHLSGAGGGGTNLPPVAAITNVVVNGLAVSVSGASSFDLDGQIVSYAWNMGDQTTLAGPTVSHTYVASGSYTITLTVTDDRGASGQAMHGPFSVIGVQPPAFRVDAGDSSFAAIGQLVTLSAQAFGGSGAVSYAWDTNGDDVADAFGQTLQAPTTGLPAGARAYKVFATDAAQSQATDTVKAFLYQAADQVSTFQNHVTAAVNDEDISGNSGLVDGATFRHDVTVNAGASRLHALLDWTRKAEVVPANPSGLDGGPSDFDLYAFSPDRGQDISSADFRSPEEVTVNVPGPGPWTFEVRSYVVADDTYTLTVTVTSPPASPVPVITELSDVCFTSATQLLAISAASGTGSLVTAAWDLDLDGAFDDATGLSATAGFPLDGSAHLVRVRATSADGFRTSSTLPVRAAATCPAEASVVVVGIADSGINAYHRDFEGVNVPYSDLRAFTTTSEDASQRGPGDVVKRDALGNMLPFTRHPANYIPGFPAEARALDLKLGGFNQGADAAIWTRTNIPIGTWFWVPGTKIIGAIDADDAGFALGPADTVPIADEHGHGTASASVAVGNFFGSCPRCLLVFAEGASGDLDHLINKRWIDLTSFSFGAAGNVGFPVISREDVTRTAAERGQTVSYAAGNGYENAFVTPEQTYTSNSLGPDWTVDVGAVTTSGTAILGTGKPVDWSSFGSGSIAGACRNNYNGNCGHSGTSAATPISTGHLASTLLNARIAIGDTEAGQKTPADAGGQRQAIAVGSAIAGSSWLSDGVLQRHELWTVAFHCASQFGTGVGFPGNGPRSQVDYAYGGYGIADAAMGLCATSALIAGTAVPAKPAADDFFDIDEDVRDALWGDWDGDGDGEPGGNHNGPASLTVPGLEELRLGDVDTVAKAASVIQDAIDALELDLDAQALTETYFLHRNGCGTGQDNTQYMDRTPKAAREAGHGCAAPAATHLDQSWTSTVATGAGFAAGSTVTATVRAFSIRPHPNVVLTGTLRADGVAVGSGESAPVTVVSVALVTTPCHEWVITFPTTSAVASGATLTFQATSPEGTQDLPMCYEGGTGASRVAITGVSGGGGGGGPTATITSPQPSEVFNVDHDSPVTVSGTAAFPAQSEAQKLYLRRDDCGNLNTDTMYLSPIDGTDAGNGCALGAGIAAPTQDFVERYPLIAGELPITLGQGGTITGTLYFGTQGLDPAQVELRVQSSAGTIGTQTLDVIVAEVLGVPGPAEVEFAIAVPNSKAGIALTDLTFEIKILRQGGLHWTELEDPPSFVEIPRSGAASGAFVEVAVDDAAFGAASLLAVTGTESWTASWDIASLGVGDHTIYARAGTGAGTGPFTSVVVALEADLPPGGVVPSVEVQFVPSGELVSATGWRPVGYDSGDESWDFDWDTFALPNGDHDFYARLLGDGVEQTRDLFTAALFNPHPPVLAAIGDREIIETELLQLSLVGTDLDGGQLTFTQEGLPVPGAVPSTGPATAALDWQTGYFDAGTYPVTVRVIDADGQSDEETFTVTVLNLNRLPTLDAISDQEVDEDQQLVVTASAHDEDTDDTLAFSITGKPAAAIFDTQAGTLAWTPTFDDAGTYAMVISVDDGKGGSAERAFTVTVINVNRPPVLDPIGDQVVDEGAVLAFTVSADDPDGNGIALSSSELPARATFDAATGEFRWQPQFNQEGTYSVTFTATDDDAVDPLSVEEIVQVLVVNVAPPARILRTGEGYFTIQEAIDAALEDDAISVRRGEHAESLTIELDGLTLCQGDEDNAACGSDPADAVLRSATGTGIYVNADGVTIEGLTILVSGESDDGLAYGIDGHATADVTGLTVRNVIIAPDLDALQVTGENAIRGHLVDSVIEDADLNGWATAVFLRPYGDNTIVRDTFIHEVGTGVSTHSPRTRIEGNVFTNVLLQAVDIAEVDDASTSADGNVLRFNDLADVATGLRLRGEASENPTSDILVDARLNDWGVYEWRLIQAKVRDEGAGNTVLLVPFLLGDGSAEPGLPVSIPASHSSDPATCNADPDAFWDGAQCRFLTVQAAIDFAHADGRVLVPMSRVQADPAPRLESLVIEQNNEGTPEALDGLTLCSTLPRSTRCVEDAKAATWVIEGAAFAPAPAGGSGQALRVETAADNGFGTVQLQLPEGIRIADLANLEFDAYYEAGGCGGGSPRYTLFVDTDGDGDRDANVNVYAGPLGSFSGCPTGTWLHHDLMEAGRWESQALGGPFGGTQGDADTAAGASHQVLSVNLIWDSAWAFADLAEVIWFDNLRVDDVLLLEPADLACGVASEAGETCPQSTVAASTIIESPAQDEPAVDVRASDVTVRGFTLRGSDPVLVATGDGVLVAENAVEAVIDLLASHNGLELSGVTGGAVRDNTIRGNEYPGSIALRIEDVTGLAVEGNTVRASGTGIYAADSSDLTIRGNTLTFPPRSEFAADSLAVSLFRGGPHTLASNAISGMGVGLNVAGAQNVASDMDSFLDTTTGVRAVTAQDDATDFGDGLEVLQPTGLSFENAFLAETATALFLGDDTTALAIDAECNDWGVYTALAIPARIDDEGTANVVDFEPFVAPDSGLLPLGCLIAPVAQFAVDPSPATRLDMVELQDQSLPGSKPIVVWDWDFGDGMGRTIAGVDGSTRHVYSAPGTYEITLTVTDLDGMTSVATASLDIVNLLPLLDPIGDRSVLHGDELRVAVHASDADDDLSLSATDLPDGAVFTDLGDGDGELVWTPTAAQIGLHPNVGVHADDGWGGVASEFINIDVLDTAPAFSGLIGPFSVLEGDPVGFDVLATDAEGDPITLSADGVPAGASFSDVGAGIGRFDWASATPAGLYTVTLSASALGQETTLPVEIAVGAGNLPPIVTAPATATVVKGDRIILTATAVDPDGGPDPIAWTVRAQPGAIGAVVRADGDEVTFDWFPPTTLTTTVTFEASDGHDAGRASTVITILRPPTVTVLAPIEVATAMIADNLIRDEPARLRGTATDPDGTIVEALFFPEGLAGASVPAVQVSPGVFEAVHTYVTSGSRTIALRATDDDGLTRTATRTVTVTNNAPPTVDAGADVAGDAARPQGLRVTLAGTATDPDGRPIPDTGFRWQLPASAGGGFRLGPTVDVFIPVGVHDIVLEVTDANGAVGSDTMRASVDDQIFGLTVLEGAEGDGDVKVVSDPNVFLFKTMDGSIRVSDDRWLGVPGAHVEGVVTYYGSVGNENGIQTAEFSGDAGADGVLQFSYKHDLLAITGGSSLASLPGYHELAITVTVPSRPEAAVQDVELFEDVVKYHVRPATP